MLDRPATPTTDRQQQPVVSSRFVLLAVASFCYFCGLASALPVLPRYLTDAGATEAEVGITVGAFGVTAILLRPTVGRLVDSVGRRPVMLVGAAVFAVTLGLHAVSAAVPFLIGMRLAAGVTEAAFFVAATTMVADLAPDARRGEALSIFSVGIYLGLAVGPLLGELLYASVGAGAFLGSAGAALLAGLIVAVGVPEQRLEEQEDDEPEPVRRGWARLGVAPTAFLPGLVLLLVITGQATFNAFVPLLGDELGLANAGAAYATFGLGVIIIRIVGRTWPDRMPPRLAGGGAVSFAAAGIVIVGLAPSLPALLLGTAVMSLGQALAFPLMSVIAVRRSGPRQRGVALSTMTAFVDISFTFAPILAGVVAQAYGLRVAFVTAGLLMCLGLPLTARLGRA